MLQQRYETIPYNYTVMDEITKILDSSRPITDVIDDLKNKSIDVPEWSKLMKDYGQPNIVS